MVGETNLTVDMSAHITATEFELFLKILKVSLQDSVN